MRGRIARGTFVIAACWLLDSLPASAQVNPPSEILAAITRSFPASIAKKRPQQVASPTSPEHAKVVGGRDAARSQFKWQVALIQSDASEGDPFSGFFCGGSLIDWRWVLTAAHCTYEDNPLGTHLPPTEIKPEGIHAYLGSHDFTDGQRIAVKRVVRHERYDPKTQDNDLALLELETEPPDRTQLGLMRIAPAGTEVRPGGKATVLGWGSTVQGLIPRDQRKSTQVLQYVDGLQFKRADQCNQHHVKEIRSLVGTILKEQGKSDSETRALQDAWYPLNSQLITDNMICAGRNDGTSDACFGDSGGPLIIYSNGIVQTGVVSWGPSEGCGLTNLFGVYVRLTRYLDWIAAMTK